MSSQATQLLRGTLDVLVMKTLAGNELHGYAIADRIAQKTDGALGVEDGALYQCLHRMEEKGWLDAAWGHADNGKRAKFYQLTAAGRKQLQAEQASWIRYAEAVFKVLQPA
ncbi:MAG: PadR family transcriptional regulator [Gemmatimonadota bacterium]